MAHPKSNLKIMGVRIDTQDKKMGLGLEFNQPIQLKENEDAHECWFLPLNYFELFFKQVRFDQV
jgi:hypothetical protein